MIAVQFGRRLNQARRRYIMKILIATDGSEYSNEAIDESCRMFGKGENEFLVVSAFEADVPVMAEPFAISAEYYQRLEDTLEEQCNTVVADAKKRIEEKSSASVSTAVLRGFADKMIVEKAGEWEADLIVVGSHGRGFWGRLLGSVSDGVVHHASCNVMVVRK